MMIDQIALSGELAYLRTSDGRISLAPGDSGISAAVLEGEVVDVNAIDLLLEFDDASLLVARGDAALMTVEISKEIFPDLYLDPHRHRIHQVAGYEDFRSAETSDFTIMETDGVPTLISPGTPELATWTSAKYALPRPMEVAAVAWTLATSKSTVRNAYSYDLALRFWPDGGSSSLPSSAAQSGLLTHDPHRPGDDRFFTFDNPVKMIGFQILFTASVIHDAAILERHSSTASERSLGTPLLQGVYLLEPRNSVYELFSVHEIIAQSSAFQFFDPSPPLQRMYARLHLPAILTEGEKITVSVSDAGIKRCEARLDAVLRTRPPEAKPKV
jgi:hypothetical protein